MSVVLQSHRPLMAGDFQSARPFGYSRVTLPFGVGRCRSVARFPAGTRGPPKASSQGPHGGDRNSVDAQVRANLSRELRGRGRLQGDTGSAAARNSGFLGLFSGGFEVFLKTLEGSLSSAHLPYSHGFSIILLTLGVKALTWPLARKQAESSLRIQSLQPKLRELQARLRHDPAALQAQTAAMYRAAGVNPLAGALPALITIPIFIGLYRALSNVANEGLLSEGFFWIPSLSGPTTHQAGLGWLKLTDGAPPLGWHDTLAYLVLPVLLVVSQYLSQRVLQPQGAGPSEAAQANIVLKFLPLMIGWFSLNVPSGLGLYWLTNNLVTTGQQLYFRQQYGMASGASTPIQDVQARQSGAPTPDLQAPAVRPSGKNLDFRQPGPTPGSTLRGNKFRALREREAAQRVGGDAAVTEESRGKVATLSLDAEATRVKVPDAPPPRSTNGGSERP